MTLSQWLRQSRLKHLVLWLIMLALLFVALSLVEIFLIETIHLWWVSFLTLSLLFVIGIKRHRLLWLDQARAVTYINAQVPELENAASLYFQVRSPNNDLEQLLLKRLQNCRIELDQLIEQQSFPMDRFWVNGLGIVFFISIMVTLVGNIIVNFDTSRADIVEQLNIADDFRIMQSLVTVVPPAYTNKQSFKQTSLDLSIPEGSEIKWSIEFNKDVSLINLVSTDKSPLAQSISNTFRHDISSIIFQSTLYRFEVNDQENRKTDFHRIEVQSDVTPKIKWLSPEASVVEKFFRLAPSLKLAAEIKDDYGISKLQMIVTVAKGSGENVKFREKVVDVPFEINERHEADEVFVSFLQILNLNDYEMEAGDEMYLKLRAVDNKSPSPQTTDSSSLIIRWLEPSETEISDDPIQIRFTAEFFRSQRQIIIDTEQLIAERMSVTEDMLREKSVDIGFSQKDLKEKYGQYLGDEFADETGGALVSHASISSHVDLSKDHDDHTEAYSEEKHASEHHHEKHENEFSNSNNSNLDDGRSALIEEYMHNHGHTEIAPLSQQDPKSLMKSAVAHMWQAEMYLMLSEPEKALPFEKEAYEYLRKAKQAERIYVQRLGFAPPPVDVSRRYKGKLNSIDSQKIGQPQRQLLSDDQVQMQRLYELLLSDRNAFSLENKEYLQLHLSNLSRSLLEQTQENTQHLEFAQQIENLLTHLSAHQSWCSGCKSQLQRILATLSGNAPSQLTRKSTTSNLSTNELINYQQKLIEFRVSMNKQEETP